MISTRNLSALPEPAQLIRICRGLAMLDAIICRQWEYRYYSFNSAWSDNEMMASMRNGQGDGYFIWFGDVGAAIKGTVKDAPMDPFDNGGTIYPGVLSGVPEQFRKPVIEEPAFTVDDTTFLVWRLSGDSSWSRGDIEWPVLKKEYCESFLNGGKDFDGSEYLLRLLDGNPVAYKEWAQDYYELADSDVELSIDDVQHVLDNRPLTGEILERMNCQCTLDGLEDDIGEIGY